MNNQVSPILQGAIDIVSAHLANNAVAVSEVAAFIRSIHVTLTELEGSQVVAEESDIGLGARRGGGARAAMPLPAVPVEQSITNEYLVCLEDGKRLRMMKRYLNTQFGLTPEAYRQKWRLPADYPMSAPSVTAQRRSEALGRNFGRTNTGRRGDKRTPK